MKVNVVGVTVTDPPTAPSFKEGTGSARKDGDALVVSSGEVKSGKVTVGKEGMKLAAKVTLVGPDGGRGVGFMDGGIVQTVTVVSNRAKYAPTGVWHISKMEGRTFLDVNDGQKPAQMPYAFVPSLAFAQQHNTTVSSVDTPTSSYPLTYNTGSLAFVDWELDFYDYLVVETLDKRAILRLNQAGQRTNKMYTPRVLLEWSFVASGPVGALRQTTRGLAARPPFLSSRTGRRLTTEPSGHSFTTRYTKPRTTGRN